MPFRVIEHTADAGVEASGGSFSELVEALATGMFSLIADIEGLPLEREVRVEVWSDTPADLVVDTLSELLWRSEVDRVVLGGFRVSADDAAHLEVIAHGASYDTVGLTGAPIKAVTYHDLEVGEDDDGWHARVYFDV
jgi:SHS2 domain-containing protein